MPDNPDDERQVYQEQDHDWDDEQVKLGALGTAAAETTGSWRSGTRLTVVALGTFEDFFTASRTVVSLEAYYRFEGAHADVGPLERAYVSG